MEAISFSAPSSKGKGVMVGFFLLVEVFLRGVTGAPSQPDSKKSSPVQNRDSDAKTAASTPLNYTWDPRNTPLWTVRPEDRQKASKSDDEPDPCANKDRPATLYKTYENNECPPKRKFLPLERGMGFADTCEEWNTERYLQYACTTFCQTSTRFEWAQEVPFPHSACYFPIFCGLSEDDSVKLGWNMGGNFKIQFIKALKIGMTGGYSHDWSESESRKFDVDLAESQCGYFTFIPVKRIIWYVCCLQAFILQTPDHVDLFSFRCGITEPDCPPRWYDFGSCKAGPKNTHLCISNGTIIFVYTDCFSRRPLPMNKQDPVYHAPGVALHHDVLDGIRQSWVGNTCYMWNMGTEGKLSLYIHGSGSKDSMIDPEGKKLIERVNHCARSVDGVISRAEFNWYYSGYAGEDPKMTGAMWVSVADVPSNIRRGCPDDAMMELGESTKDKCIGEKFEGCVFSPGLRLCWRVS
ncbi:uncharacterized protein LY79DRAFT_591377 [Colletotrichum navitas]|uniref:Uncharacterized protein n=1 Tax=Colletotrichum navitas TaxID=681940 RepID=A0AAD8V1M8_9PEZI|nr:uncharacterized protein LY79DRAFT_591377 [Colletotrichum navitas]KAK1585516.1 hypothetical protein LY79DRAFT_591377 [Colletotrichum navitas]